eukprot:CAMPEP_0185751914 /NCGR_PEP_ID=MMETSP1174-20130828/10680_1 /TAXON_ID=35687 /ORGANISM="Dictyocha speculum, Strain CCMP1381" /LENGTH=203 /DNA_ID=CAMNT_0028429103 /DNA_START=23 /DNA_END=634 /DNA_ORIENTATION=+
MTCLKQYTALERLEESEVWKCYNCKQNCRAYKKIDLWSTPDVLCVQFKRFSSTDDRCDKVRHSRRRKVDVLVEYPEFLDLSAMVIGDQAGSAAAAGSSSSNSVSCKYDLIGVVQHTGDLSTGHYTSRAKVQSDILRSQSSSSKWFEFNDKVVKPLPHGPGASTKNAYMLFYQRRGKEMRHGGVKAAQEGEWKRATRGVKPASS